MPAQSTDETPNKHTIKHHAKYQLVICVHCRTHENVYSRHEDYICRENSQPIAIINYLFSVNFHGSIFSLLYIWRENCVCKRIYWSCEI